MKVPAGGPTAGVRAGQSSWSPATLAASPPLQVRLDEHVEVAVDHRLHVAGLGPCSLVLHELVRRERVRADLIPEGDVTLVTRQGLDLLAVFLAGALGEPGREDLHRLGLVLGLRPLVLTRHHDAASEDA